MTQRRGCIFRRVVIKLLVTIQRFKLSELLAPGSRQALSLASIFKIHPIQSEFLEAEVKVKVHKWVSENNQNQELTLLYRTLISTVL